MKPLLGWETLGRVEHPPARTVRNCWLKPIPLQLQETLVVQEILGPVQCAWSEMSFFGLMVSVQEGYSSGSSARAALLSPPESVLKKHLYHIRWQGIRLVIILSLPSFQVKLIANEVFTNRR